MVPSLGIFNASAILAFCTEDKCSLDVDLIAWKRVMSGGRGQLGNLAYINYVYYEWRKDPRKESTET